MDAPTWSSASLQNSPPKCGFDPNKASMQTRRWVFPWASFKHNQTRTLSGTQRTHGLMNVLPAIFLAHLCKVELAQNTVAVAMVEGLQEASAVGRAVLGCFGGNQRKTKAQFSLPFFVIESTPYLTQAYMWLSIQRQWNLWVPKLKQKTAGIIKVVSKTQAQE